MPSAFHALTKRIQKSVKKTKKKIRKRRSLPKAPSFDEEDAGEVFDEGFRLKPSASSAAHAIQPLGNLLLAGAGSGNIRDPGVGSLRALSDELFLDILALLPARGLAALSAASKSLYVFATHEPLWRNLVLDELKGSFFFAGSWRSTYVSSIDSRGAAALVPPSPSLCIKNFYSDYLFQSWLCANMEMKPEWIAWDTIERRQGISIEEFVSDFEVPNKPLLLEGCLESWPALRKWTHEHLVKACVGTEFSVGPVHMTLDRYFRYADMAKEERPLYLFDPKFAEKVPELGLDYEVPVYFREDLFGVLGHERPDYRWIIMGPAGSGSSFHVDPNSTSAWNAVIKGSKKWVMFPPEVVPPGVHPSPDGAEVACPVSIVEWFMNFYGACRTWKRRPVECIARAGEVVFVPNGWWHLVINLEDSIAITQNYVSRRNLLNVLDFLRRPNAIELVSGTKDRINLHDKFRSALDSAYPGLVDRLELEAEEKSSQKKKITFWESVADANSGGFKFSF